MILTGYKSAVWITDQVHKGLKSKRPTSFLIEIPPGCEEEDVTTRIHSLISSDSNLNSYVATASADEVGSEKELVDLFIRGWTSHGSQDLNHWTTEIRQMGDLPVPQRLKYFLHYCARRDNAFRILITKRFDKIFRQMSGELLAVMRDLEHESLLVSINGSPMPYDELYRKRSVVQPGFTSDYGQSHVRVVLGPLTEEEALKRWTHIFGLPIDDRLSRAHFDLAYRFSGGLPSAFSKAAASAINVMPFTDDIRVYRAELSQQLPPTFERLLRYEGNDDSSKLVEAVARIHLGSATSEDGDILKGHRWRAFFITDSDHLGLKTEALGQMAVVMLRNSKRSEQIHPEILYEQGEYKACCKSLSDPSYSTRLVLKIASKMLADVFGDTPGSLYFGPNIDWTKVRTMARDASQLCPNEAARVEFERWQFIAKAFANRKQHVAHPIKTEEHYDLFSEVAIRLGLRLLAISQDNSDVTATHMGIPLIEEILRAYVLFVLNLEDLGISFKDVAPDEITKWWLDPKQFLYPEPQSKLSASSLALIAAIHSDRRNQLLFPDSKELSRTLRLLDQVRNILGHYVTTPQTQDRLRLISSAKLLFGNLCQHGNLSFGLEDLQHWVKPPRRFLSH